MWFLPRKQPPRVVLGSSMLEMRLKMALGDAWDIGQTRCVPTDRSYLSTTKDEIRQIARKAWKPWVETKLGGGACEIQCFRILVEAFDYSQKLQLPGRLAIYAALTRGDRAHAYIVGELSATQTVVYDQTADEFCDADEMDKPIRIVYS